MKPLHQLTLTVAACLLSGCAFLAVQTAPAKVASSSRSALALKADAMFWDTLHGGNYAGISRALELMTAAYLQDPADAISAAHVGWLHIWTLAEHGRNEAQSARVTDHAVMARRYFQEAVRLDPSEARYLGFLGSAQLAEGSIHKDERLTREGYFTLLASVDAWPEFNLFTAGYTFSRLPAASGQFQDGLAMQWKTLDLCVGESVDRANPDFARYMSLSTTTGRKRVCWNSWIAPHNLEGFFLNMGDMLVKAGDWQTAQKIYANARHSTDYASWKLAPVLETRIAEAEANVAKFNGSSVSVGAARVPMMGQSTFACMGCHQR